MSNFSIPRQKTKELSNISNALLNTVTISGNKWKKLAAVKTDFAKDLLPVRCIVGEINQVFLNIILNAVEAIELRKKKEAFDGEIIITAKNDKDYITISFKDNGIGICDDIINKIFDPFFTTKKVGEGVGDGLTSSYNSVVRNHKGKIEVNTTIGKGSEFIIYLPYE